ncbi:MAG: DNA polymerase III subunit epsilon [Sphingobacteriia bacterium]|nr:DNA polymerase III subunit epsilon [Sphingobacteriia bacterium]
MQPLIREIILDTETTGLNPANNHRIIEIGCVELINRVKTGVEFHTYIDPKRNIPEDSFRIHGISLDFLKKNNAPFFEDIAHTFLEFIGDASLIIHNASFDVKFLNHHLIELGFLPVDHNRKIVDTLTLARTKFPGSPINLDALCRRFKIDLSSREKHGALIDSNLLADVYIQLTGGYQDSLTIDVTKKQIEEIIITRRNLFSRENPTQISEEEKLAHLEILSKIKEPLWSI